MPITLPQELEKSLLQIESQLETGAEALESGDPMTLEVASASLRQACLDFSRLIEASPAAFSSAQSKRRLQKIAASMAIQREGLLRRAAGVERTLGIIIPEADVATYAQSSGLYGASVKSSGAFRQYSA